MKNKYLVEVYLPAAGCAYEMRLPRQIKVAQALHMIVEYVRSRDEGEYVPGDDARLYDRNTGHLYEFNAFVETSGITDGARLMLI